MGGGRAKRGKGMEEIRAANCLTNKDGGGGGWIAVNRQPLKAGQEGRGRDARTGGRRRRA